LQDMGLHRLPYRLRYIGLIKWLTFIYSYITVALALVPVALTIVNAVNAKPYSK
jgi:hypothetical protein